MTVDLTTADFVAALPFSKAIEGRQIRASITDSYTLDLLPVLGHETLENLAGLTAFTLSSYASAADLPGLPQGAYVVRRENVYQALQFPPTLPPPADPSELTGTAVPVFEPQFEPQFGEAAETAQWAYCPLQTLWSQYLKSYWLQAAYVRFLSNHGVNVTKAGLTVPTDPNLGTYGRPSANQVASLLADARITAEARLSRLTRFLRLNNLLYFYDPTTGSGFLGGLDSEGYERVPGDPPLTAAQRALRPTRRRHSSTFRGV